MVLIIQVGNSGLHLPHNCPDQTRMRIMEEGHLHNSRWVFRNTQCCRVTLLGLLLVACRSDLFSFAGKKRFEAANYGFDYPSVLYKHLAKIWILKCERVVNIPPQNGIEFLNLLAQDFFFLILTHIVYKMWIIQELNMLELWNNPRFEEEIRRV